MASTTLWWLVAFLEAAGVIWTITLAVSWWRARCFLRELRRYYESLRRDE